MDLPLTKNKRALQFISNTALINFFAFSMIALAIGGNAINGEAINGKYYLFYYRYREMQEVTDFIYIYSYIHTASVMITHPLGLAALNKIRKEEIPNE